MGGERAGQEFRPRHDHRVVRMRDGRIVSDGPSTPTTGGFGVPAEDVA